MIEIDITSLSLDKLPLYAQVGVAEVWRYDGEHLAIFKLEGNEYVESAESYALPKVTSEILTKFIEESTQLKRTAWLRRVREWARQQRSAGQ